MTITEVPADAAPRAALAPAAALFSGLGDSTRLALLRRLAKGEARVVDLVAELGLAQSTVSAHLACLRDCGLVDFRPRGRASVYSLTHPELLDLLTTAESLLAATGNAVALCPGFGDPRPEPRPATTAETTHDEESTR
ncbi:ArsR family transcriptional regulator [Blastococcus sp. CT_GayMR19]|uniref:ArsR/SmtB family transcription factor n=1 Tax=Blastococcus sp. CT_GayMR19 TaxID=2559608 RepID=UPI00107413B7|nr:metalloregulator ArsR/SmtB family transcription factor [Blastococcus sp. CT_GayMR19]TFV79367.1 ArsR family transcriptional regulator [Blastococcus sp. CT_GayMR19]